MTIIGKEFPVLDKGSVCLLDISPHPLTGVSPDMAIVSAARVSFLGESKGEEADKRLLFYLMRHHHDSPFEMVTFKIRIHAPIVTFWHLVRYRMMSVNAQSGRYTEAAEDEFYIPYVWRKQAVSNKQASDGWFAPDSDLSYKHMTRLMEQYRIGYQYYQDALSDGIAREQARLFLNNFAQYTTWVISINARSLMHIFQQRLPTDAQEEIRVYAECLYRDIFKPLCPWTAEAFEEYTLKKE